MSIRVDSLVEEPSFRAGGFFFLERCIYILNVLAVTQ